MDTERRTRKGHAQTTRQSTMISPPELIAFLPPLLNSVMAEAEQASDLAA
jgi:hypothetical protein